jgi:glycosyltransferase involved in cell wall biosynthesis
LFAQKSKAMSKLRRKVCFFVRTRTPQDLQYKQFYSNDMRILHDLGYEVCITTDVLNIPRGIDLILAWWWTWSWVPVLQGRLSGVPVVITGVFNYECYPPERSYAGRSWPQRKIMAWNLRHAAANVFLTRYEMEKVCSHLYVHNPCVSPCVLDLSRYPLFDRPADSQLLVSISQLLRLHNRRKRVPELLRAIAHVRELVPEVRLSILGDKNDGTEEVESLIRQLGLENIVELVGKVSEAEKIDYFRRAAVYCQPSAFEGFGMAIAEAMACGVPVVTTRAGAIPEVVGEDAIFCDGADPRDLADKIIELLKNQDLRQELGRRGSQRIRSHFPYERRREELGCLFETLI